MKFAGSAQPRAAGDDASAAIVAERESCSIPACRDQARAISTCQMDETSTFVASFRSWTPEWVIALRLGLACILGGLIGLERELGRHDAGLRTHMLVAIG